MRLGQEKGGAARRSAMRERTRMVHEGEEGSERGEGRRKREGRKTAKERQGWVGSRGQGAKRGGEKGSEGERMAVRGRGGHAGQYLTYKDVGKAGADDDNRVGGGHIAYEGEGRTRTEAWARRVASE